MKLRTSLVLAAFALSAGAAQAADSVLVLGKSTFNARCALCHGQDAMGTGDIAELFKVRPSDLTKLAKNNGDKFPFSEVYHTIVEGMQERGHGENKMPIWGDYFMADALQDRGVSPGEAMEIAAGRILSLVYYLESIQQ